MGFCPGKRFLFAVKKTIDDDRVALSRSPSARTRGFAVDHTRSAVHSHTRRIRKDYFAAIRDSLWINSTMRFAQPCTVPRRMLARTFAMPVNRHARQH